MDLYKFETLIVDLFAKMGYGKLQYESHVNNLGLIEPSVRHG